MCLVFPRLGEVPPSSQLLSRWLYLSRVEGMEGGKARRQLLEQYMASLAKVVSQPQAPQGKAIIRDVGDMMSLALKCVYSCERCEQLDAA
ncbi:hypothetical protein EMCRGX_G021663 [Ephydatia muelleri]